MVKMIENPQNFVKLQRGSKVIQRTQQDYEVNKLMYDARGFKPYVESVKKTTDKVVELKPKKRKNVKKTKKKD
tara:strand:+ start:1426 stop:1644 length:219 start_codon:yes stop_codon:yes gene_type:complete